MDKVLIVDDDRVFLQLLQVALKGYGNRFDIITALNGREAIEVLKAENIKLLVTDIQMPEVDGLELLAYINDHHPAVLKAENIKLLVTDIQMPEVDGLELLAYINDHHPAIPCFVMTAWDPPGLKEKFPVDVLRYYRKPFDTEDFAAAILEALTRKTPSGAMYGISVTGFLHMIHLEKKSCLFEVEVTPEVKGLFYFEKGELFDAVYGSRRGEEAARQILTHKRASFRFRKMPPQKVSRRINTELLTLIQEALAQQQDESGGQQDETDRDDGAEGAAAGPEDER
jgi:CheY-like chemotaxis protein